MYLNNYFFTFSERKYSVYQGSRQAILGYGGLILGLSQFQVITESCPKIIAHIKGGLK